MKITVFFGAVILVLPMANVAEPQSKGIETVLKPTAVSGEKSDAHESENVAAIITLTDDLRFFPAHFDIEQDQTVLWKNTSQMVHTITADPARAADSSHVALPEGAESFDSGDLQPGDSFRHIFKVPGVYHYFCVPHEKEGMRGTIVVNAY